MKHSQVLLLLSRRKSLMYIYVVGFCLNVVGNVAAIKSTNIIHIKKYQNKIIISLKGKTHKSSHGEAVYSLEK